MKKYPVLFCLIVSLCHTVQGQEVLTLRECYELAQVNFPLIRQYGLIKQTEEYNLSNAAKGWLPQIGINAKASYQSDVTQLPFDSDMLSSVIPGFEIPVISKDQYQLTGEVTQPLWDGGVIRTSRELTRLQADLERAQLTSDLYTLNERVNQLYFGALLQDQLLAQNQLFQNDLQINIDRIHVMMENGVANLSDRESVEVELLNARQQEIELENNRQAYRQMLGVLIGRPIDENTLLDLPVLPAYPHGVINRPELYTFDAQEKLIEGQNRQLNTGLMPRFNLFVQGGYGRPGLNMLSDSFEPYYIAGVRMVWNPGNFYTLKNDRRKLDVNRRQIGIRRETFLFNTNLDLLQQNREIAKATELIKSDEEIIRMRNNIKKASEIKLENGVISVTDLIRDINAEDQARQNAAIHRIQQLQAVYNYLYTTNE